MVTLSLNLGIDFGTRYTKICIRDTGRGQSWIVRPGKADSTLNEALILSQVGIDRDDKIYAGMTQYEWQSMKVPCATTVDYIKMRLAHLDIAQTDSRWYSPHIENVVSDGLQIEDILENICAFFLFKVIQRSQVWFSEYQKNLLKNMTLEWSASVGVPVAYWDSPALGRFEKVLGLAWYLIENPPSHETFKYINSRLMELKGQFNIEETPCCAIPEVAAAISSFTNSRQVKPGVYMFFDVGGGTIEGTSFEFYRDNEDHKRINFYTASVEPLGVNSIAKKLIKWFPKIKEKFIEDGIVFNSKQTLELIAEKSSLFTTLVNRRGLHIANQHEAFYEIVEQNLDYDDWDTFFIQTLILSQWWIHKQVAQVFIRCFKKVEYSGQIFLFLSGGGKISDYYRDTIYLTYDVFRIKSTQRPRYQYLELPGPGDCSMSDIDHENFHRFTVAYGLSIPEYDYPKIGLPAQFPNLSPQRAKPSWVPETSLDD